MELQIPVFCAADPSQKRKMGRVRVDIPAPARSRPAFMLRRPDMPTTWHDAEEGLWASIGKDVVRHVRQLCLVSLQSGGDVMETIFQSNARSERHNEPVEVLPDFTETPLGQALRRQAARFFRAVDGTVCMRSPGPVFLTFKHWQSGEFAMRWCDPPMALSRHGERRASFTADQAELALELVRTHTPSPVVDFPAYVRTNVVSYMPGRRMDSIEHAAFVSFVAVELQHEMLLSLHQTARERLMAIQDLRRKLGRFTGLNGLLQHTPVSSFDWCEPADLGSVPELLKRVLEIRDADESPRTDGLEERRINLARHGVERSLDPEDEAAISGFLAP